jgi:hypothetical protein
VVAINLVVPFYWHERVLARYLAGQEDKLFDVIIYTVGALGLRLGGLWGRYAALPDQEEKAPHEVE